MRRHALLVGGRRPQAPHVLAVHARQHAHPAVCLSLAGEAKFLLRDFDEQRLHQFGELWISDALSEHQAGHRVERLPDRAYQSFGRGHSRLLELTAGSPTLVRGSSCVGIFYTSFVLTWETFPHKMALKTGAASRVEARDGAPSQSFQPQGGIPC